MPILLHLFNTLSWSEIKRSLSITVLFKGYLTFFLYKVHKGDGSSQAKRPCGPSAFCVITIPGILGESRGLLLLVVPDADEAAGWGEGGICPD